MLQSTNLTGTCVCSIKFAPGLRLVLVVVVLLQIVLASTSATREQTVGAVLN